MARSIGIPARVVSGWAVSQSEGPQTVKLNQAHQGAEVAFEGLGWVTFEPTGSLGAPSRAELAAAESWKMEQVSRLAMKGNSNRDQTGTRKAKGWSGDQRDPGNIRGRGTGTTGTRASKT